MPDLTEERLGWLRRHRGLHSVFCQLGMQGPVRDGDLISKADRNELCNLGLVIRHDGINYLSKLGNQVFNDLFGPDFVDES